MPHDQRICNGNAYSCLAYIGVYGASNSSFSLLLTEQDHETGVELHDGIEQSFTPQSAGSYGFFYFSVGEDVLSVQYSVTPTSGDPDLYITTNASYPTRQSFMCGAAPVAAAPRSALGPESSPFRDADSRGSSTLSTHSLTLLRFAVAGGAPLTLRERR